MSPYIPYIPYGASAMLCVYPFCTHKREGRTRWADSHSGPSTSAERPRGHVTAPASTILPTPALAALPASPRRTRSRRNARRRSGWPRSGRPSPRGRGSTPTLSRRESLQSLKGLTVAEWSNAWLVDLERGAAASTLRKRRSDLRRHILPYIGDQELTELTPASLAQWWADLDATPGARKNAYETMRALLNAAAADDRTLLESSPLRIKGGAREARVISKFLSTPGQVAALAAEMPAPYRALVILLADAGLRINEALALTRASLLEREDGGMSVRVEASLHRVGRHLEAGPTKTAAGVRTVALMASTATTMRGHLRTHVAPGPQAVLFPALRGSGFARDTALTRLLTAAQAAAGIEIPDGHSGGWHALRHYSATRYGQAGATTRALMARYGWSDPDMAARYQRSDEAYELEMIARMETRVKQH